MLARHRQEHARHFGILTHVFINGLTDEVAKRHIILGLAAHLARMTSETTPSIDKPSVFLAIVRRLHSMAPKIFWEEFVTWRLCFSSLRFNACCRRQNH